MTEKEFTEKCKGIMASTELTLGEKEILIQHQASLFTDSIFRDSPECRDWRKRLEAAERRLAGYNGFSYCPHDGEWSPECPPEIKALDKEFVELTHRKTEETFQKVWTGATA